MKNYRTVTAGLVLLGVFGAGAASTTLFRKENTLSSIASGSCATRFPLTSRSLDCIDYDVSSAKMDALDAKLTDAIRRFTKEGRVSRASVWVRDLETRQYAAVNELDTYEPASLLKLPLAIVYFKYAEISPSIMDATFTYKTPREFDEKYNYFTATTSLRDGTQYNVRELIKLMLTRSDNGAYFTLLQNVEADFYNRVMLELGIQIPSNKLVLDFITVKTYANIFRGLYNASYLNRENSQEILEYLASSDFKGIASALPSNETISHKFGERSFYDPHGKLIGNELHDCGIIYEGKHPYSLCIMTAGSDFDALYDVLKDISKLTYDNI